MPTLSKAEVGNTVPAQAVTDSLTARTRRGRASERRVDGLLSFLLLVTILVLGEVVSRAGLVSHLILPAPSAVANALWAGIESGIYWEHLLSTLTGLAGGFVIAVAAGGVLGGLLASFPRLERVLFPFVIAFQSLPKIAIAPLVVLWVGFGASSKVVLVAIVCFFPVLINTLQGLRLRDRDRMELAIALGANKWQIFRYIRLPGSMPYVFAGLHVAVILALLAAIVAEFVGSRSGLGVLLEQQRAAFNTPGVFAILLILMALGLVINQTMKALEKRVTFWSRETDTLVI